MNDFLAITSLSVMLVSLLTYKRNGAKYRFFVSFLAWVFMVFIFAMIVKIATGAIESCFLVNVALIIASIIACMNKGNVAKLIRVERHE